MRKLIAAAVLGGGAALFAATAPVQAMPASGAAGIANKIATQENAGLHEVRRRWKHRRKYRGSRKWRPRYYGHRRYYRPRYYYGYPGYYGYRYHRRPRVGIYLRF